MRITDPDERTWLRGLAIACPLGKALPCCPMNGFRNLPASQIRNITGQMSDEQVHTAIKSHQHCFEERVRASRSPQHHDACSMGGAE